MWSDLALLILVTAVLPAQTIVTLVLARSSIRAACAWVAGMMLVRLFQGVLFGLVLGASESELDSGPQYFLGAILLVLALLLYAKGLRAVIGADDEDAPPTWIEKVKAMSPASAFRAGAVFMTISVKFLVFTLGAISVITDAHVGIRLSTVTFVVFVVLAHSAPLSILALASSSSSRSAAILDAFRAWLQRNNRAITIVFALVFGTWFLLKAAARLRLI